MPAIIVVGVQWGDEGKGKIVHRLARRADMVVRYQGGNNAGHSVVFGGREFALHLVPSGILVPGRVNLIANGVVVSPSAFRDEVRALSSRGVRVRGRLFVSPAAHVILPTHVLIDSLREERGRGIGTTRRGIGPCYEDKVARLGVRVCDYLDRPRFRALVEQNLRVRRAELTSGGAALREVRAAVFKDYEALRRFLKPFVRDTSLLLNEALDAGRKVLFESAQGAMLDLDFGTYPFVTSSSPIAGGACCGAGVGPTRISEVIGVAKAYTTRVGLGPFPTESEGPAGRYIREKGHEYGTTTGRPRRVGWLDLVQLRRALRVNGVTRLALTKLDTLSGVHPIKACVAYRLPGGRRAAEFPDSRADQLECDPIYESFPGFSGDLSGVRRFRDLPLEAREYVLWIERAIRVPVSIVSVGRDEEQTLSRGAANARHGSAGASLL